MYQSYVKATDLTISWRYYYQNGNIPMELTWAFVPAGTSNRTVSYSFDMNALRYFDLVELSNGIKLTDKASTHKHSFNITLTHPDGITYIAKCNFNYDSSSEWHVVITKA